MNTRFSSTRTAALGICLTASAVAVAPVVAMTYSVSAQAAGTTISKGTTFNTSTNVRKTPSTAYAAVGKLPIRTVVTGTVSNGWMKIATPTAHAGRYVATSTLKGLTTVTPTATSTPTPATPTPTPTTTSTPTPTPTTPTPAVEGPDATVTIKTTNIRPRPDYSQARVTYIATGTKLTGTISSGWMKISTPSNLAGRYVDMADFTSTSFNGKTTKSTAARASGDWYGSVLAYVPSGTTVSGQLINGWVRIASPTGHAGRFVLASDLAVTAPPIPVGQLKTPFTCTTRPVMPATANTGCTKAVQYVLNSWMMRTNPGGTSMMTVTGTYATLTQANMKAFQKANGINESGTTDAATWAAIEKASQTTGAVTTDGVKTGDTHLAFPSAIRLADNRLMVVFRSAQGHLPGVTVTPSMWKIYSSDGGYTWTTPQKITLPSGMQTTSSGLAIATSGPLKGYPIMTTWSQKLDGSGKVLGTYTHVTVATDLSGSSWGPLVPVNMIAGSTFTAAPVIQIDDTNFGQAGYVWVGGAAQARSVGITWDGATFIVGTPSVIAEATDGSQYTEPNLLKLADGRILALIRNDNSVGQAHIWKNYSSDGGKTWGTSVPAFAGTGAPHMTLTASGKIVVVYRHLDGPSTAANNRLEVGDRDAVYRVWSDNGATWSAEKRVGVRSGSEMTYGVPIENSDGSITFVYGDEANGNVSKIVVTGNVKVG